MDGTLLDSDACITRAWSDFAARRALPVADVLSLVPGRTAAEIVSAFLPDADDVRREVAHLQTFQLRHLEGIVAVRGALELLSRLDGLPWAVVTSAPREVARLRLRAAGLPAAPLLLADEDVQRSKPDPEGFLAAAAALGTDIGRCVVFEDSAAGLRAAHASGAQVVALAPSAPVPDGVGLTVRDLREVRVRRDGQGHAVDLLRVQGP
nr:HAD-IA family hydrolase [Kineococcus xinjiangensis]